MNVILFSPATNNIGETYTLGKYAKELIKEGNKCRFIAPELGNKYLQSMGFNSSDILVCSRINNQIDENNNYSTFTSFIEEFNPKFALIADWHEFQISGISKNNSYSLNWIKDNIKIGTFDHFGYAPNGIETYFAAYGEKKYYPPVPERYSFIIRPCPHHDNTVRQEGSMYYWAVTKTISPEKNNIIENNRSKIKILLPIGFWQEIIINKMLFENNLEINYYEQILLPIIMTVLSHFNIKFELYVVAYGNKTISKKKQDNIEIIYLPPQSHLSFNNYLNNCDIILTDNFLSSNIGKTLNKKIISIVLNNSLSISELKEKINKFSELTKNALNTMCHHKLIYPFTTFPRGLNEFPIINNKTNPFLATFLICELFDKENLINAFEEILFSNEKRRCIKLAKEIYLQNNTKLLTSTEILQNINK